MAAPRPPQTLHTLKQGREREGGKGRKTNQDGFRAVQIGGSAGCRSNQLMQLSWRPAVDHLPGSRVAVVAVSAGLAPRRAGPRGREGAICPAPGCSCCSRRGPALEPALPAAPCPLPPPRAPTPTPGRAWPGLSARNGQPGWVLCGGFARSPNAATQTGCVHGASLSLPLFTPCVWGRDRDTSCPSGAVGTLRNR